MDDELTPEQIAARKAEIAAEQEAKLAALGGGDPRDGKTGDRVFTLGEQAWTVRVRVQDAIIPQLPDGITSATDLAAQKIGLCITAVPLDDAGAVLTDPDGGVQLFATSLTIQTDHEADLDYDPERTLMLAIADHLTASAAQLATRQKVPQMLELWGNS